MSSWGCTACAACGGARASRHHLFALSRFPRARVFSIVPADSGALHPGLQQRSWLGIAQGGLWSQECAGSLDRGGF